MVAPSQTSLIWFPTKICFLLSHLQWPSQNSISSFRTYIPIAFNIWYSHIKIPPITFNYTFPTIVHTSYVASTFATRSLLLFFTHYSSLTLHLSIPSHRESNRKWPNFFSLCLLLAKSINITPTNPTFHPYVRFYFYFSFSPLLFIRKSLVILFCFVLIRAWKGKHHGCHCWKSEVCSQL